MEKGFSQIHPTALATCLVRFWHRNIWLPTGCLGLDGRRP
jgi:hypothetical protein